MDVMDAIYHRRSVRSYTDRPVDKGTVEALINAATHTPSSMNEQPWAFAVIQNPMQLVAWSDRIKAYPAHRDPSQYDVGRNGGEGSSGLALRNT